MPHANWGGSGPGVWPSSFRSQVGRMGRRHVHAALDEARTGQDIRIQGPSQGAPPRPLAHARSIERQDRQPGQYIDIKGNFSDYTDEVKLLNGSTVDIETYGIGGFWSEVQRVYENWIWMSLPSSLRIAWNGVLKPRHFLGVRLAVRTMSWISSSDTLSMSM